MKEKLPPIRTIAKIAGVSASTVSRALNSDVPVSPAARKKIEDAIAFLQTSNEQKISGSSRCVGIIISSVSGNDLGGHPSIYAIVSSFTECLAAHSISYRKLIYRDAAADISELLQTPMDGYFVIGTSEVQDAVILEELNSRHIPFLIINRDMVSTHVSSVNFDDEYASEMAVNYLIELGHRRIAFVGGDREFQNSKRRYSGYLTALQNAGIHQQEELVLFGEYTELSGYQQGKALLGLRQRPTAVYCASDTIAIGCMNYLTSHGLRLPRDLAVIGFGNIDASRSCVPPLTTIDQPDTDAGNVAAKALIQLIETPSIAYQQILVKTELVIRESSGGPVKRK